MQLDAGAIRHSEVGHYDLITVQATPPDLSERNTAVFGFFRVPSMPAQIANHRRADGGLIIYDERTPLSTGGGVRGMRISLGHCGTEKPRQGGPAGGAVG